MSPIVTKGISPKSPRFIFRSGSALPLKTSSKKDNSFNILASRVLPGAPTAAYKNLLLYDFKAKLFTVYFFEAIISLHLQIYMVMKAIPCTNSWKAVIFYKSTNFDFPLLVRLRQLHVFVVKVGNYKANYLIEKYASRFFRNPKNVFQNGVCYPVLLPTVYLVMLAPAQSWLVVRPAHPIRY